MVSSPAADAVTPTQRARPRSRPGPGACSQPEDWPPQAQPKPAGKPVVFKSRPAATGTGPFARGLVDGFNPRPARNSSWPPPATSFGVPFFPRPANWPPPLSWRLVELRRGLVSIHGQPETGRHCAARFGVLVDAVFQSTASPKTGRHPRRGHVPLHRWEVSIHGQPEDWPPRQTLMPRVPLYQQFQSTASPRLAATFSGSSFAGSDP